MTDACHSQSIVTRVHAPRQVLVRLDRKIGEAEAAKLAAAEAEDYQEAARQKRLLGELREQRKSAVTAGPVRRGASTRVSRFAALATRYARPRSGGSDRGDRGGAQEVARAAQPVGLAEGGEVIFLQAALFLCMNYPKKEERPEV